MLQIYPFQSRKNCTTQRTIHFWIHLLSIQIHWFCSLEITELHRYNIYFRMYICKSKLTLNYFQLLKHKRAFYNRTLNAFQNAICGLGCSGSIISSAHSTTYNIYQIEQSISSFQLYMNSVIMFLTPTFGVGLCQTPIISFEMKLVAMYRLKLICKITKIALLTMIESVDN